MRDVALRKQKDQWLTPFATQMMGSVHPNLISVVAMLIGLAAAFAIANRFYGTGLVLWLLNRSLDGLDGLVARIHHKQSDFGGYFDLLLDFIVYLAVPIAFLVADPTSTNLWAGVVLFTVYVLNTISWTTLSALLEKRRSTTSNRLTSMEMPTGLVEGAETILFYTLFCLFPWMIAPLFILMALLVLFTAGQRVVWAWKNL